VPDIEFDINDLKDVVLALKPFRSCPCEAQRKEIVGVTKTDVVYRCPSCGSSWLSSERCQQCAAPATTVINTFGICERCARDYEG
jgi:hypothetical protein